MTNSGLPERRFGLSRLRLHDQHSPPRSPIGRWTALWQWIRRRFGQTPSSSPPPPSTPSPVPPAGAPLRLRLRESSTNSTPITARRGSARSKNGRLHLENTTQTLCLACGQSLHLFPPSISCPECTKEIHADCSAMAGDKCPSCKTPYNG